LDRGQLFLADLRRESCEEIELAALGIEAAHYERSVQVQPDQVVSLLTNETQAKLVERLSDFGEDTQGFGKRLWESRVVRGRRRQRSYEELEGPPEPRSGRRRYSASQVRRRREFHIKSQ